MIILNSTNLSQGSIQVIKLGTLTLTRFNQ